MARMRQSKLDSGLGFHVKVLATGLVVLSSLSSGMVSFRPALRVRSNPRSQPSSRSMDVAGICRPEVRIRGIDKEDLNLLRSADRTRPEPPLLVNPLEPIYSGTWFMLKDLGLRVEVLRFGVWGLGFGV